MNDNLVSSTLKYKKIMNDGRVGARADFVPHGRNLSWNVQEELRPPLCSRLRACPEDLINTIPFLEKLSKWPRQTNRQTWKKRFDCLVLASFWTNPDTGRSIPFRAIRSRRVAKNVVVHWFVNIPQGAKPNICGTRLDAARRGSTP